jgi:hypothetical protein
MSELRPSSTTCALRYSAPSPTLPRRHYLGARLKLGYSATCKESRGETSLTMRGSNCTKETTSLEHSAATAYQIASLSNPTSLARRRRWYPGPSPFWRVEASSPS